MVMNMTEDNKNALNKILAAQFDGKTLQELSKVKLSDLDIDSMDFVDMIFDIEEALGITIDDANIDYTLTLEEFIQQFD